MYFTNVSIYSYKKINTSTFKKAKTINLNKISRCFRQKKKNQDANIFHKPENF